MNIHIARAPALDASEAIPAPLPIPTVEQDWSRLVTPGHVLRARLLKRAGISVALAFGAAFACVSLAFVGSNISRLELPASFYLNVLVDPTTFTPMPDGALTSYRLQWLADMPAQAGFLSSADWTSFVAAVRKDMSDFGTDVGAWEAVGALATAPRITRPTKVFEPEAVARLSTGVVSIGMGERTVDAISYVDGRLSWLQISTSACRVLTGPEVAGCATSSFTPREIVEHVAGFKPDGKE